MGSSNSYFCSNRARTSCPAELRKRRPRDGELSCAQSHLWEQPKAGILPSFWWRNKEKPVKKWHFVCTRKYTHMQSRKGRPFPCLSLLLLIFLLVTTQIKPPRAPTKPAILRAYRRAPGQQQQNEPFGTPAPLPYTDPGTVGPGPGDGTERAATPPTRPLARGHKQEHPSPTKLSALYSATTIHKVQTWSGTSESRGLTLNTCFASKSKA